MGGEGLGFLRLRVAKGLGFTVQVLGLIRVQRLPFRASKGLALRLQRFRAL